MNERLVNDVLRTCGGSQDSSRLHRDADPRAAHRSCRDAMSGCAVTSWDQSCQFPGCPHQKAAGCDVCTLHAHVRVSSTGSWVNDRHDNGGHG